VSFFIDLRDFTSDPLGVALAVGRFQLSGQEFIELSHLMDVGIG